MYIKKLREQLLDEPNCILVIKHLGVEPYNEITFADSSKLIVAGSLTALESRLPLTEQYMRINKGIIVNTQLCPQQNNQFIINSIAYSIARRRKTPSKSQQPFTTKKIKVKITQ